MEPFGIKIFKQIFNRWVYFKKTKRLKIKALKVELNEIQIDRVIEMAWEDRTPFDAIKSQFGLSESEVITIMRNQISPKSWKNWRERVQGRKTKHLAFYSEGTFRHKCNLQRSITHNKISKR
jgi:uncharacterized protein (TIGR03643 family)